MSADLAHEPVVPKPCLDVPVAYCRPTTVAEAVAELADPSAVALSGGTDLVTMRQAGTVARNRIIDVKSVPELRAVEVGPEAAAIGAAVTMREIAQLDALQLGAVVDGAAVVGAPQTRARATLGGNVCRASPAGDTLAGLLVLGAEVELASVSGTRRLALNDFFTGPGRTRAVPEELAVRFVIPLQDGGSAYVRQTYRSWLDLAVAGVAVRVSVDGDGMCTAAAVAMSAVGPTPLLVPKAAAALLGTRCGPDAVAAAGRAAVEVAHPIDDVRGTRAYRLQVLPTLLQRALTRALVRCADRSPVVSEA